MVMIQQGKLDKITAHAHARDVEVDALRRRLAKAEEDMAAKEDIFLAKLNELKTTFRTEFDALQAQFDAFRASCTCGARDSAS